MALVNSDIVFYCPANTPESDTTTSGGAIDLNFRPSFTGGAQLASNITVQAASSNGASDGGKKLKVSGRIASGAKDFELITISGTDNSMASAGSPKTWERILKVELFASDGTTPTDAVGTITLERTDNNSDICTIPPTEQGVKVMFNDSAADPSGGSTQTFYESVWVKNNNSSSDLTNATLALTSDDSVMDWGFATGSDQTVANRKTEPSSAPSWITSSAAQTLSGGTLSATETAQLWVRMQLSAGAASRKSTFTFTVQGTTV